ncbi:MAG: hypothetical protein JKY46_07305 [Robiginitomaculum sp.]|nr:hypothetical protein [Robiginitomaculum sp.]
MKSRLVYVELKSGHSDNGPAWIGIAVFSKSRRTVYFNGLSLKKSGGQCIAGNHYELQTGDEYWVSGIKKNNQDRHLCGGGPIIIDDLAIGQYLNETGSSQLPKNMSPGTLISSEINPKHHALENKPLYD